MGIYEELGVRRVINCASHYTPLGQNVMHHDVVQAMAEAAESPVPILELERKCAKIIANICGAEDALLTTSATGGILLAFAGAAMRETELTKYDPFAEPLHHLPKELRDIMKLVQLQFLDPSKIKGIKTEFIVPMAHESYYTAQGVFAGLKPVFAGTKEKCTQEQIAGKISDKTAAIWFNGEMMWAYGYPDARGRHGTDVLSGVAPVPLAKAYEASLEEIIEVGHQHNVPIIMDAALTIPPVENLSKWSKMGVDIACFCGGKTVGGPMDVGFNVGRKDLIRLSACHRFPFHGIGRGMKIDKTQMVAVTKALQRYPQEVEEAMKFGHKVADWLVGELNTIPHIKDAEKKIGQYPLSGSMHYPYVRFKVDEAGLGLKTEDVINLLYDGEPCIWVWGPGNIYCPGGIGMNCSIIYLTSNRRYPGNERMIVARLREIVTKKR